MPLHEMVIPAPLMLNQGRNSEIRRITDATPVILSAWDSRPASKLYPCIAVPDAPPPTADGLAPPAPDGPAGIVARPPTGAPHLAHEAAPSATVLPHCAQNI